jgi:hypothetical protein
MEQIIDDALEYFEKSYKTSSELEFPNLYDILANMLLTAHGKRFGFLVQKVDYKDKDIYKYIINIIENTPEPLLILMNTELCIIKIHQGTYVTAINRKKELKKLLKENEENDTILGKLLSYPCAGDIGKENTKIVRFYVEPGHKDIFSNLCLEENIQTFIEKCTEMGEFIKTITMNKLNYSIDY